MIEIEIVPLLSSIREFSMVPQLQSICDEYNLQNGELSIYPSHDNTGDNYNYNCSVFFTI